MTTSAVPLRGVAPLTPRLEPWMRKVLDRPALLADLVSLHGSPLNLIDPGPLRRNAAELAAAADGAGVRSRVYFARKANKSIGILDAAIADGHGVDVASVAELEQALGRGADPARVIVTAAVKPRELFELCARSGVVVAIDNADELELAQAVASELGRTLPVAFRLQATAAAPGRPPSRFGLPAADIPPLWEGVLRATPGTPPLRLEGLHFHFDGYDPSDRSRAIEAALGLADELAALGARIRFVDIGGGIPMRYLDDASEWDEFWRRQAAAVAGDAPSLTYLNHGLGLTAAGGEVHGNPDVYPAAQELIRGDWLERVLEPVAAGIRSRDLELRCEPGRTLLDGCGMTVARVMFRKAGAAGDSLVGLAMNRTQMRSATADSMLDPFLVRPPGVGRPSEPFEGYLVGAYCIERELISWRRFQFSAGAAVGDLVAFPNTAGYFMHILESSSHQMPLARNLLMADGEPVGLDPIDSGTS